MKGEGVEESGVQEEDTFDKNVKKVMKLIHVKELPKYRPNGPEIVGGQQNIFKDEPYNDHTFDPQNQKHATAGRAPAIQNTHHKRNSDLSEGSGVMFREVVSDDTSFDIEIGESLFSGTKLKDKLTTLNS